MGSLCVEHASFLWFEDEIEMVTTVLYANWVVSAGVDVGVGIDADGRQKATNAYLRTDPALTLPSLI